VSRSRSSNQADPSGGLSVLVTDAEERSSLAACRGLAQAGYRVTAVAGATPAPSHWSRACHRRVTLPDPREYPDAYLRGLEDILRGKHHDFLIASTDVTTWLISEHRERFEGLVRLVLPEPETVRATLDKCLLIEEASSVDLAAPESLICEDLESGLAAADELGFPLIVKSRRSFVATGSGFDRMSVRLVTEAAALVDALAGVESPFLVQRYEQGGSVVSCSGVMTPDGLLGFAAVRWERRWPVDEGATSYCRTIKPPDNLAARVEKLLASVGFWGIFELELLELSEGQLLAIDLNPRLFGWLALPVAAGANLPAVLVDWLRGLDPAPVEARAGVYYRWEDADARHFLWQLRKGDFKAAARVLRLRRRVVHPHFQLTDPGPLVARAGLVFRTWLKRRGHHDELALLPAPARHDVSV
jgi:predicted ATP-grasp superfamily ATP-dependent carboligase